MTDKELWDIFDAAKTETDGPLWRGSKRAMADELVTVCSACLRASCWNYDFACDDYRTAGTVEKTAAELVAELVALGLEHPDHFLRAASTSAKP